MAGLSSVSPLSSVCSEELFYLMRFLPLIGFSCFTVATLFTRCVFDPSPFLFFLFSGADSFVLVPLDRDRFAVAIVNRATALIFYSSLSSVLCCIICVFYDTLIKEETYSFLTSIFILFSGFVFSLFVWLFDLRFLPFSLAFYSSGASNASSTAERRDLPTTLFSILADSYDTVFVFCFIFSLFIVFSFFYSPLSSVGARWFVRLSLIGSLFYFFGGEGFLSDALVTGLAVIGSELWLFYFSFITNLQRSTYY